MKTLILIITSICSLLFIANSNAQTTIYNYTGSVQTFVVPSGVNQLSLDMYGAKGGDGGLGTKIGGAGGRLQTTLSVVPGQTLYIYVGGQGIDGDCSSNGPFLGGFNGGGDAYFCGGSGGGASDIRINGTSINDRVVVAGGGGGAGDDYPSGDKGGDGGDLIGQNGEYGTDPLHSASGEGGSQSTGGAGGVNPSPSIDDALSGGLGFGGRGSTTYAGGGGGGGYFGGGGGAGAGAGGGSSYADPLLTSGTSHTRGEAIAGQVYITEICSNEPLPDEVNLTDVTANCEVTSLTAPTATSCSGTFTGVPNVSFPITTVGTTTITWTYDDGNGNTSTQTQDVIINDVTAPVADIASLTNVTSECEITALTAPTATDNCVGSVTGTHNATLPITSQGTTTVTWTYDDGNGNTSTQTQDVVIDDVSAPVADAASLTDLTDECEITALTAPTATDNCVGSVTVTNDATLPITATTTITWTYDDGNGNTSTQTQEVIIDDVTAPVADVATLADLTDECEITSLTAPTATDNCAGSVTVTNDATLPITATTTITWTYDDGNGNTSTQTQDVIITPIDNGVTQVDAITLSADASGYSYQWVDCNDNNSPIAGETNQTFTATVAGSYAVEISNGNCMVTSNCLEATVGLKEHSISEISVYPNPTDGVVMISSENQFNKVEVLNALGQKVGDFQFFDVKKYSLKMPEEIGVYFIKITSTEKNEIFRVVRQ